MELDKDGLTLTPNLTLTLALIRELAEEDKASFVADCSQLDWDHFWTQVHIPFMRRYLLKESQPRAKL